jgi:hypothetical protein
VTNGYFKVTSFHSTTPGGDFYFFDSQSFKSLNEAWQRAFRKAQLLDESVTYGTKKVIPSKITHWGWIPMRGPWSATLHVGHIHRVPAEELS